MDETTVPVEFHAATSGISPMTWGQQAIWRPIEAYGEDSSYFNMTRVLPLPPGTELTAVLDALRDWVAANQALRSRYLNGPGGPCQDVRPDGTLPVTVARLPPEQLAHRLAARCFRHAEEWPVRVAVDTSAGQARCVVFVLSHLAADWWGFELLLEEFTNRLAGPVEERAWQPLDQTAHERSPAGRRASAAALAHWRERLSVVPVSMFDFPAFTPERPRYQRLRLASPALAVAAELLATANRVSTSSVLLAGVAVSLAALSGRRTCVLKLVSSNRNDARLRRLAAPTAQNCLFVLDDLGPDLTMCEVIRQCYRRGMTAYSCGRYDPAAMDELIAEVAVRRGVCFDLKAYFNDVRGGQDRWPDVDSAGASRAQVAALMARTVVSHDSAWEHQGCRYFLNVERAPDHALLYLLADTAYLPTPAIERALRAVETVLVEAAFRPVRVAEVPALTGQRPPERGGWWPTGSGWACPLAMAEVVRAAAGAEHAAVFREPGELTAFVAAPELAGGLKSLHHRVVGLLDGRTDAVAPHRYVVCGAAPADPTSLAAWLTVPPLDADDGRQS